MTIYFRFNMNIETKGKNEEKTPFVKPETLPFGVEVPTKNQNINLKKKNLLKCDGSMDSGHNRSKCGKKFSSSQRNANQMHIYLFRM